MRLARRVARRAQHGQSGQPGPNRSGCHDGTRALRAGCLAPGARLEMRGGGTGPRRGVDRAQDEELHPGANDSSGCGLAGRSHGVSRCVFRRMRSLRAGPAFLGLCLLHLDRATERRNRIAEVSARRQQMVSHQFAVALGKSDRSAERQV